jgi:glycosyltransferase involved in cell wall biosynthesis
MGRKILICDFDIFSAVGGGQTVYQSIVRKSPDDTFYYFGSAPAPGHPENVIPVPFLPFYDILAIDVPQPQGHFCWVYRDAMNMARSLREALGEIRFDVVDTPDYRQNGLFIRHALEAHGIAVGVVALALHGTLSSAFRNAWPWSDDPRRAFAELVMREHMQFRCVDARYAISPFYADALQRYAPFPINMLDPLVVIRDTQPSAPASEARAADLVFVGRRERRKGPDIFLDAAWWLPEGSYRRLVFVGGDGHNHQGTGSQAVLEAMAVRRRLDVEYLPPVSQSALQDLTRQKSLIFVPSRYDQFNLVALESLLDGCPTVISRSAGVARFIEERLPDLSWLLVDLTCDRTSIVPMTSILQDYDRKRHGIVDALQKAALDPDLDSLRHIYDPADKSDRRVRGTLHDLADRFAMSSLGARHVPTRSQTAVANVTRRLQTARHTAALFARHTRNVLRSPRLTAKVNTKVLVNRAHIKFYKFEEFAAREVLQLLSARQVQRNLLAGDERTRSNRINKLSYLTEMVTQRRFNRTFYFREMIRLERLRGNDLIAATYALRIIRWLGRDDYKLLGFIQDTFREHGFVREAEAVQAMYGDPARAEAACRAFLDDQLTRHRVNPDRPWEIIDDRRTGQAPRVSIIVSMYNAATKLPTFWNMLRQHEMLHSGEAEIVLVDSGSPSNEYSVFQQLCARDPMPVVYARSKGRETIQTAWNRGIRLASGQYLAFLGVDEGVHPDTFRILADKLDQNPATDWVIADSIVTEVDRAGAFSRDIMMYNRAGYRQDWHYLDTTYLSYVGGLYRRNIHDRLGYYDESFRAAGDTEFKNRILPYIRSEHVPLPLGVFNNYPEERTTQHPRAEIEDLRAWYLHRTPAGVAYAFDQRPAEDVVELLKDTLGCKKCYFLHTSTDIELADSLATYLATGSRASQYRETAAAVRRILEMFRTFERLQPTRQAPFPEIAFARDYQEIQRLSRGIARDLGRESPPAFDVFHDNRYEQHWWSWS